MTNKLNIYKAELNRFLKEWEQEIKSESFTTKDREELEKEISEKKKELKEELERKLMFLDQITSDFDISSNQIKKDIKRICFEEEISLSKLADKLNISQPALSNKLQKDGIKYEDVCRILDKLGYKIVWVKVNEEEKK